MHTINLRYYVYVSVGVATLVMLLVDPELLGASRIAALFTSLATLSRELVAAVK